MLSKLRSWRVPAFAPSQSCRLCPDLSWDRSDSLGVIINGSVERLISFLVIQETWRVWDRSLSGWGCGSFYSLSVEVDIVKWLILFQCTIYTKRWDGILWFKTKTKERHNPEVLHVRTNVSLSLNPHLVKWIGKIQAGIGQWGSTPYPCFGPQLYWEFVSFLHTGVNFKMRKNFDIPNGSWNTNIPILRSRGDTALWKDESNLLVKKRMIRKQQQSNSI